MKEDLILFETAKLAKEKGFNLVTRHSYDGVGQFMSDQWNKWAVHKDFCPATTQSLLQKWLREIYGIVVLVSIDSVSLADNHEFEFRYNVNILQPSSETIMTKCDRYDYGDDSGVDTVEKALEIGLVEGLKLIK